MSRTLTLPLLLLACQPAPGDDASSAGDASTSTTFITNPTDTSEGSGTTQPGEPTTGEPTSTTGETGDDTTTGAPPLALDGPCELDVADPTRLAVITNNFMDPAMLHVLDLADASLTADVAPAPADPALAWGDGKLVLIGRFGINTLEVLDGASLAPLAEIAVTVDGVAEPNPQALAFGPDGRSYLTLFGSPLVPIHDLSQEPGDTRLGRIDLAAFADADGSPEAGVAFACGDVLFVAIQRLVDFAPVDLSYFVAVDLASGAPIDLDPATAGPQALPLLGPWPKQVRRDPADPAGHTVLALTSGLERVDLSLGTSTWAVAPELLADVGVETFDAQGFAVAADGASVYLLATDGDYPAAAVFHVGLDGGEPAAPVQLVAGLTSRERTIERVGDTLWVGDASPAIPRLRRFDLAARPVGELETVVTPGEPFLTLAIP